MLDADEFDDWFRLLETPGLGRDGARRLLALHGSPAAALAALPRRADDDTIETRLRVARQWLADGTGRHAISLADAEYPPQLLHSADPPLLLYVIGRVELLARDSLAIVGSRNASAQGMDNAHAFAAHLSAAGWCVVSGLAVGIDAAAHEGALSAPGGTIAVLGTGLDRVYPSRHRALAHRIADAGALVSEFAPGTPALPTHFPLRNRIIAALSRGTLVVEAALRSGSLITARLAAEAGREVFAVPGSIHSPLSRGCHALIRQGAKLVESGDDILDELQPRRTARAPTAAPPATPEDPLLAALGHDPTTLDALGARTGWSVQALSARLLELEFDGHVRRLPGGLYQRHGRA